MGHAEMHGPALSNEFLIDGHGNGQFLLFSGVTKISFWFLFSFCKNQACSRALGNSTAPCPGHIGFLGKSTGRLDGITGEK